MLEKPDGEDAPLDRRQFFRRGFFQIFKPLSSSVAPLQRVAAELGKLDAPRQNPAPPAPDPLSGLLFLRPPGAIAERQFLTTCQRGGQCVRACPAQCIKIDSTGSKAGGAPFIDADTSACLVCDGLYCMDVCPSGALKRTPRVDIDMGTAVWREESCLRETGQSCTICVDRCPLGEVAIRLHRGRVEVQPLSCIGCGVCQQQCPTSPKSIFVIPKAAKER